ncbi:MAG: hypothetical protein K6U87_14370 [Firmicutes bacterium]|nr:hypothetical protein [Bacillota bacterium]
MMGVEVLALEALEALGGAALEEDVVDAVCARVRIPREDIPAAVAEIRMALAELEQQGKVRGKGTAAGRLWLSPWQSP